MESLFNRYRNITVLLLVVFAQIVLLAYQVKNESDVRVIRVWAVTVITPIANIVEDVRSGVFGFFTTYFSLRDVREDNRKMHAELNKLKLDNQFLRNELATAERAQALIAFQSRTPSKMLAARIIGTATGANQVVFADRGSTAGVKKGMAVVTPDGIVGKVLASFPTASQVLMATDPGFAAGVTSQKNHVHGILRGVGHGACKVDYVQNEETVDEGEMFYTSGDDRVFPKGLPAGKAKGVHNGSVFKEIALDPSGLQTAPEEVLIILEGVHQGIPEPQQLPSQAMYLGPDVTPAPPPAGQSAQTPVPAPEKPLAQTDADRLREHYKQLGEAQGHKFGEGLPGSKPPDFNLKLPPQPGASNPAGQTAAQKRPPTLPSSPAPLRIPALKAVQPKPAPPPER